MSTPSVLSSFLTEKDERYFSIEGLSDREALVLKSMVRLLEHLTHHTWRYVPATTELIVASERLSAAIKSSARAQEVLTLGVASSNQPGFLCLPMHARELEAELNRLGAAIVPTRRAATLPATLPGLAVHATRYKYGQAEPMRLLRWPHAGLLKQPGRLRLATLMTGKSVTVQALQRSSGESLAICSAFFDDLQRADLLVPAPLAAPAATPVDGALPGTHVNALLRQGLALEKTPVTTSLFARIRKRLGIEQNGQNASTPNTG